MIGKLKLWLAGIGAVAIALLAAWFSGKKAGRDAANAEELNEYVETRKRMDAADHDGDAREWLRGRGKQ